MQHQQHHFPPLPEIGLPESHYAKLAQQADRIGNMFAREAAKVGQYVTLALSPTLDWPSKQRYFDHAIRRHCIAPPLPNEAVWMFFQRLADLVRQFAGREALRLASLEDEHYAFLTKSGVPMNQTSMKAEVFFNTLLGLDGLRPTIFTEEDWRQLKMLRTHWVIDMRATRNGTAMRLG
jgi:hypothetical protein